MSININKLGEYLDNKSDFLKEYLSKKSEELEEKRIALRLLETIGCDHAFVRTSYTRYKDNDVVIIESDCFCLKCGITRNFIEDELDDKHELDDAMLMNETKVCSRNLAIQIYKEIISTNPNISNRELKLLFNDKLSTDLPEEDIYNTTSKILTRKR